MADYQTDYYLRLDGATDDGSTLNWTSVSDLGPDHQLVVDLNNDGNLDTGDYFAFPSLEFTGYLITINGNEYGVFKDVTAYFVPYQKNSEDISALISEPGSSSSKVTSTTDAANCFLADTLIRTPSGQRKVQELSPGDLVLTTDNCAVPVKWIGRQTTNAQHSDAKLQPVCIQAGALGDGLPERDLFVTADHGMVIEGFIVNASALVNGSTIRWVPRSGLPAFLTVYHVETERHDVIFANGAPAETFIDYAGRRAFDNFDEFLDLHGAERIIPEMPMPRISSQRKIPQSVMAQIAPPDQQDAPSALKRRA